MSGIPKISIILRVRNQENLINRALDSILKQSLSEIELICIDNCSSDHTLDILRGYEKEDDRIYLIANPKDMGLLYSDVIGLRAARGEYVTFVDGDDTIPPGACERMYKIAKESAADIIQLPFSFCVGSNVDSGLQTAIQSYFRPYPTPLFGEEISRKSVLERKYAWNIIGKLFSNSICKKTIEDISTPYVIFADDMILYTFLAFFANSYIGEPDIQPCYVYSIGTGETTAATTLSLEAFRQKCSILKAQDLLIEFFQKQNALKEYEEYCTQIPQNLMNDILYIWLTKVAPENQREGFAFLCETADVDLIAGSVLDLHYIRTDLEIEIGKGNELISRQNATLAEITHRLGEKETALSEHIQRAEAQRLQLAEQAQRLEEQSFALVRCRQELDEQSLALGECRQALTHIKESELKILNSIGKLEVLLNCERVKRAFKIENFVSKFLEAGFFRKIKLLFQLLLHVWGCKNMKTEFPLYEEAGTYVSEIKENVRSNKTDEM